MSIQMPSTPDSQPAKLPKRRRKIIALAIALALLVVLFWPIAARIPVLGANERSWNSQSFWYEPWGVSGVHKGIDIFAPAGTPALASVPGIVVYAGTLGIGGNVVAILGPQCRVHYYAHLQSSQVATLDWVRRGQVVGAVGTSGNAAGKPPHLHFAVISAMPLPWRWSGKTQGWKQMFFLNPAQLFHQDN
jgi:peptidoglycan LD-endopeptidase LytH